MGINFGTEMLSSTCPSCAWIILSSAVLFTHLGIPILVRLFSLLNLRSTLGVVFMAYQICRVAAAPTTMIKVLHEAVTNLLSAGNAGNTSYDAHVDLTSLPWHRRVQH